MKHILLLDDDPDEYELLLAALKEIGLPIELQWFREVEDVCRKLDEPAAAFDMLLLDINLPKITGFDCLRDLKKKGYLEGLPVIMYSNSNYTANIQEAFSLGATAYLQKTTSFHLLITNLKKILQWNLVSAIALPAFERTLLN